MQASSADEALEMQSAPMYGNHSYAVMLADRIRVNAYRDAIRSIVRRGSVVAEIGTGVGYFAVLAARAGASRVYAFEVTPSVQVAAEVARANGDLPIQFIQGDSTQIQLNEQVDVLLSDLRGSLPLHGDHLRTIVDARTRLLKPNGTLIPGEDILYASLVSAPSEYAATIGLWDTIEDDVKLGPARSVEVNTPQRVALKPGSLLSDPVQFARISYRDVTDYSVTGDFQMRPTRDGVCHGIACWFETKLLQNIGYSAHPDAPRTVYGQLLLPFAQPTDLRAGDTVEVGLSAKFGGHGYTWSWRGRTPQGVFEHSHRPIVSLIKVGLDQ